MFDKLRRRRAAVLPVSRPPAARAPAPAVADAAMLARVDRVRGALAAGVNLEELGAATEPSWFAHVRSGQRLPLGPAEL
ncbi:hypothetical protein [Streptomyces umbrinus]|uniref:hypothetical protein n=1 Tax=Streptomyces umbrinus TaxID=67370 RepID=UPI0033C0E938